MDSVDRFRILASHRKKSLRHARVLRLVPKHPGDPQSRCPLPNQKDYVEASDAMRIQSEDSRGGNAVLDARKHEYKGESNPLRRRRDCRKYVCARHGCAPSQRSHSPSDSLRPFRVFFLLALRGKAVLQASSAGRAGSPSIVVPFSCLEGQMESNGYASVARAISQDPDKETYIFRRFDRLTARNLLKLQGELLALQDELDALDAKAASSPDPDLHLSMRSWKAMKANAQSGQVRDGKEETKRLQLAEEIEVKLKKYRRFPRNELNLHMVSTWHQTYVPGIGKHFRYSQERNNDQTGLADKALILSQEAMKLESPDRRMLEAHRYALKDVALDERTKLEGAEDLVALKPPADKDILSQTLRSHWPFPSTVSIRSSNIE